jgi:hypothetical protein
MGTESVPATPVIEGIFRRMMGRERMGNLCKGTVVTRREMEKVGSWGTPRLPS